MLKIKLIYLKSAKKLIITIYLRWINKIYSRKERDLCVFIRKQYGNGCGWVVLRLFLFTVIVYERYGVISVIIATGSQGC